MGLRQGATQWFILDCFSFLLCFYHPVPSSWSTKSQTKSLSKILVSDFRRTKRKVPDFCLSGSRGEKKADESATAQSCGCLAGPQLEPKSLSFLRSTFSTNWVIHSQSFHPSFSDTSTSRKPEWGRAFPHHSPSLPSLQAQHAGTTVPCQQGGMVFASEQC